MKISILIPCFNEEITIERCIYSCLNQTRPPDEIIIVNDSSTDNTSNLLKKFELIPSIKIVTTPYNAGNKSYAQEYGLPFVTGDVFITTDGDTILEKNFISCIEKDMVDDSTVAVSGYVESIKYNWITACRAFDYVINQNIDKLAQTYINFIFVIPGAAGAFRTNVFKSKIKFEHDTVTEDLDFTYRLHEMGYKIKYNKKAICYTQDPTTLKSYINQMRRWLRGGWQNVIKHLMMKKQLGMTFELSLVYIEGLLFSFFLFIMPIINIYIALELLIIYSLYTFILGTYVYIKTKRLEFLFCFPCCVFLKYINSWIFLEEFFKEVIFRKKNLIWYKPKRIIIK